MSKVDKAEQGAAHHHAAEPAPAKAPKHVEAPPETLADFIKRNERDDVVLVEVHHPEADGRLYPGRFSGIRTEKGEPFAKWADGTTDPATTD